MQYNEVKVIEFLTELFQNGQSYNAINSARSALSAVLCSDREITIGNSSVVKRFMKGIFEIRPPNVKYKFIWDVNVVLNFLTNFYPLEDINLCYLTHKLCMLLALSSMQRVQTLQAIDIRNIYFRGKSVIIPIGKLLKQSNQKKNSFAIMLKVYEDPSICVVETLKYYLKATKNIRKNTNQLLISYQKPHNAVSKDTVSRWLKTVLTEAGIDSEVFKGHSTRAASSSAAMRENIGIDEILRTAGWNNSKTFKTFYDKVIVEDDQFADVL